MQWSNKGTVGYLDQHSVLAEGQTIRDVLRDAFSDLFELDKELQAAYMEMTDCDEARMNELLEKTGEWQEELEHRGFTKSMPPSSARRRASGL